MKLTFLTPKEEENLPNKNPFLMGERCEYLPWFLLGIRLDDNTLVGTLMLFNINGISRKAEIGMNVFHPRGTLVAYKAFRELTQEAFKRLELNRIYVKIHSDNKRCLSCIKRTGFIFEGVERQALLIDGKYKDIVVFSRIKSDFERGDQKCQQATKLLRLTTKAKQLLSLIHLSILNLKIIKVLSTKLKN